MADLDRYLRYLARDDVKELLLQSGKVAALKLDGGKLHPLTKSPLGSGHIVALLEGIGWGALVPRQDSAGQRQSARSNGVSYTCRIARRKDQLQVVVTPATANAPSTNDAAIAQALAAVESVREGQPAGSPPRASPSSSPNKGATPAGGSVSFAIREPRYTWSSGDPESRLLAMLREARDAGATDVHVVGNQPARLRRLAKLEPIGEALHDVEDMLLPLLDQTSERTRERFAELGYADFAVELPGAGRLRVNFARGQGGLKGCFRLVVRQPPSLDQLGLPHELQKLAQYHQGMAIVSGPSGHGKTTTMAALVDLVNRSKPHHIITVEDPIEVVHPIRKAVISQRQVGLHTESFHAALKGALREDPDVIVIGELRDRETVEMALQAAETGHLVIASMSTPSGAKTIDRLIDMFPPDDQAQVRSTLAGALKIVVSQRLVPTADGKGLIAAAELITGNIPLWSLIRENKLFQLPSLLQRGRNYGMISAEDSLNELLERGVITEAAAKRFADDPKRIGVKAGGASSSTPNPNPAAKPPGREDLGKAALGAVRSMFGRGRSKDDED